MEMLMSASIKCKLKAMVDLGSRLNPLPAIAFNAVGGYYVSSHQVALMVGYATAL